MVELIVFTRNCPNLHANEGAKKLVSILTFIVSPKLRWEFAMIKYNPLSPIILTQKKVAKKR